MSAIVSKLTTRKSLYRETTIEKNYVQTVSTKLNQLNLIESIQIKFLLKLLNKKMVTYFLISLLFTNKTGGEDQIYPT